MKLSQLAVFGIAAVVSAAQNHRHIHRHADKHAGSPIEVRAPDIVTSVVAGPTETVYELNGKEMDAAAVAQGVSAGYYILVSESSTSTKSSTSASPSTSTTEAAQFFQKPTTTSAKPTTTSTSSPPPPPPPPSTSSKPPAPSTSAAASSSSSSGNSGGTGLDSEFPSGTIPCSAFPSAYGPVAADWLGLNGWIGIQNVPDYSPGDSSISYISTGVVGSNTGCTAKSYCSYACPAGYQKSQWPAAQGNTGQSIGGIYCNADGKLELARPSVPQLCVPGTGQVKVQNKIGAQVSICRTDYPGTESETVPLSVEPGQTYDLTCPDASDYYQWEGASTSAQYYINPSGVGVADACQWQTADAAGSWHGAPGNIGNWAPVNMGVGKGPDGTTYISLFQNAPTNPSGSLDYTITITGGVSGSCSYSGGKYWNNGVASSSGCTVLVTGTATYVISS